MFNFIDYDFNTIEGYKKAIIETLDHELEVFDPICDGAVSESEGMAYLREEVDKFFKKHKDVDLEDIQSEMISYLEKRENKIGMTSAQKIGYRDSLSMLEEIFEDIDNHKKSLVESNSCQSLD